MRGGYAFTKASTSAPASSARRLLSSARLFFTSFPRRRVKACLYRGSWRAETLLLMSLHVVSKIQTFRLASRGCAFGTATVEPRKVCPSSLVYYILYTIDENYPFYITTK